MSYVVGSRPSARALRRRRRPGVVLGVVALLLAAAFFSALGLWAVGPSRTAVTTCPPTASKAAAPGQVTVNVLNATNRTSLAAATAKLVRERGFVVATVQNDPVKKPVASPAVVRFGPNGETGAQLVLALVSGAVPSRDTRADGSVDLVLGDAFTALAPPTTRGPTTSPC